LQRHMKGERFTTPSHFLHDPRREARSNGVECAGRSFRLRQRSHYDLRSTADIGAFLDVVANECRRALLTAAELAVEVGELGATSATRQSSRRKDDPLSTRASKSRPRRMFFGGPVHRRAGQPDHDAQATEARPCELRAQLAARASRCVQPPLVDGTLSLSAKRWGAVGFPRWMTRREELGEDVRRGVSPVVLSLHPQSPADPAQRVIARLTCVILTYWVPVWLARSQVPDPVKST